MRLCHSLLAATLMSLPLLAFAQQRPFDQAWGIIESGDRSPTRLQEPIAITRIDGQSTSNARRPDAVAPGKRTVGLHFSSSRKLVGDQSRTIEIDVQPCMRYRVVAQFESAVSGQWEPVVLAPETIGECARRFLQPAKK